MIKRSKTCAREQAAKRTLHSCPCVSMPVLQNGFGQNIKILRARRHARRFPQERGRPPEILPTCSHTDAQARPPKSRENTTFSWGSMTDRQAGSCLAESSGRACKGKGRGEIQNCRFGSFAHTREGMGILVTDFSLTKYRPHTRGMGLNGPKFSH